MLKRAGAPPLLISESLHFGAYSHTIAVSQKGCCSHPSTVGDRDCSIDAGLRQITGLLLEMICADFLAGANLDSGQPEVLLRTISRLFTFLPGEQKQAFADLVSQQVQ